MYIRDLYQWILHHRLRTSNDEGFINEHVSARPSCRPSSMVTFILIFLCSSFYYRNTIHITVSRRGSMPHLQQVLFSVSVSTKNSDKSIRKRSLLPCSSYPYVTPLMNTLQICIIYYTVAVSIDRCLNVVFEVNTIHSSCKIRNSLRTVITITLVSIIFIIPYWLQYRVLARVTDTGRTCYRLVCK